MASHRAIGNHHFTSPISPQFCFYLMHIFFYLMHIFFVLGNFAIEHQFYSYFKPFLLIGMGFLFKLLVQFIYNTEICDPYQQFVWDTYLFMLPLVAGLVIQFIFPHSVKFFMKILLYISLIVIPYTIFTHMNYYLDLYVYGLFTLKVKLSNIHMIV